MAQAIPTTLPGLSLQERDRRYAAIREQLRLRGVDCAIVSDSNLFYLTNGLPGERSGLFTAEERPMTVALNSRHLADLPAQVIIDSQDWIEDVRPGNDATPIINRIKELHLEKGTVGVVGSDISHAVHSQLTEGLPELKLVDVSDIFANVRTIKSDDEIAMIAQANLVFDAAIDAVRQYARPGMLGSEVVQEGTRAMWAAGGDLDSTFGFTLGPTPKQNPVLAYLSLSRRIQPGDIGTMTGHAHYRSYGGHSDQELTFGQPQTQHQEMFDAILHVRNAVLEAVKPGATQRGLVETYQAACKETGFRSSPHSQIHQYGIDVPEFPGPAFRAPNQGDGSGRGDFVLASGMIYSISPTLVAREGDDTLLGGTSLVVTDTGYRDLTDRSVELLVVR